jgi:hypothetical protein
MREFRFLLDFFLQMVTLLLSHLQMSVSHKEPKSIPMDLLN